MAKSKKYEISLHDGGKSEFNTGSKSAVGIVIAACKKMNINLECLYRVRKHADYITFNFKCSGEDCRWTIREVK